MIIGTQSSTRLENNICSVFGSKFLSSLTPLVVSTAIDFGDAGKVTDTKVDSNSSAEMGGEYEHGVNSHSEGDAGAATVPSAENSIAVCAPTHKIVGFISKVGTGVGRSDNDRQFLYCNGRPVDMPKVVKAINEVGDVTSHL
jgi:DNA mismatch repair ATPase MutL